MALVYLRGYSAYSEAWAILSRLRSSTASRQLADASTERCAAVKRLGEARAVRLA